MAHKIITACRKVTTDEKQNWLLINVLFNEGDKTETPPPPPQRVNNKTNKTKTCAEFKFDLSQFSFMFAFVTSFNEKHCLLRFLRELQNWSTHPVAKEKPLLLVGSAELAGATDESGLDGWPGSPKSKRPPVRFIFVLINMLDMDTSMQTQIVLLHPRRTKHKVPRRGGCAFGGHFLSTLGLCSLHRQVSKTHWHQLHASCN